MNVQEKKDFIESYMAEMKKLFLEEVDKYPEEWDGFELRWYLARAFTAETKWGSTSKVARKRAFSKALQVLPLRY